MPAPKTVNVNASTFGRLVAQAEQRDKATKLGLFDHLKGVLVTLGGSISGIIGVLSAVIIARAGATQALDTAAAAAGLPSVRLPQIIPDSLNLPHAVQTTLASHAITAYTMHKAGLLWPAYNSATKPGEAAVNTVLNTAGYGLVVCAYTVSITASKSMSYAGSLTYKASAKALPVVGKVASDAVAIVLTGVILAGQGAAFVSRKSAHKTADAVVFGYHKLQDTAPKAKEMLDQGLSKAAEGYVAVKSSVYMPSFASVKANGVALKNYFKESINDTIEGVGIIYNRNCPRRNKA